MQVEQFVMAYQAEQDRLRALLPEGFTSLRPVLRINGEIRRTDDAQETVYLEFNTPVSAQGKRGWLNIARWESGEFTYEKADCTVTFRSPFLEIAYTAVGITGGCPAERDNDGCFYADGFVPAESITENREFCDCAFSWHFAEGDAHGVSESGKTLPAFLTEPQRQYPKDALTAPAAARIPCEQVLGAYVVRFQRKTT